MILLKILGKFLLNKVFLNKFLETFSSKLIANSLVKFLKNTNKFKKALQRLETNKLLKLEKLVNEELKNRQTIFQKEQEKQEQAQSEYCLLFSSWINDGYYDSFSKTITINLSNGKSLTFPANRNHWENMKKMRGKDGMSGAGSYMWHNIPLWMSKRVKTFRNVTPPLFSNYYYD